MTRFLIKRVYEPAESSDGYRVLVDRIWPRGVSKAEAKLDEWRKELGPSTKLRKWFGHDPRKFSEFRDKYEEELKNSKDLENDFEEWKRHDVVTFVYSAHDQEHNQAVVLRDFVAR